MPNPQIGCRNLTTNDVHVPMCDGANRSKCSARLYFDTHQVPIVAGSGNNWANTWAPEFGGRKWVLGVRDWPSQNGAFGFG